MRFQLLAALVPLVMAHEDEGFALGSPEPPEPTTAPDAALVQHLLQPRASADNTCGWVNAVQSNSLTCIGSGQCARNTLNSVFGCCSNLASCNLPTACIDSSLAQYLTASNANGLTQVCTGSMPHCQTYFGFGAMAGYYGFGCGTQAFEVFLVYPTYSGGRSTAGVVAATAAGGSGGSVQTAAPFNAVGGGSITRSQPSSTGSSSSNSSSSNSGGGSGGGLSTGAIIGIAVAAGVVGIAIIALVAFFVHKRYKNKKLRQQQQQQQPMQYTQVPPHQGPQGPPYQPQPGGYYDPGKADVTSQAESGVPQNQQPGEWDFAKQGVAHYQTAPGPENDGIKVTEIRPDEAVDERLQAMSQVGSTTVAPTALAPTMVSHHPQGV